MLFWLCFPEIEKEISHREHSSIFLFPKGFLLHERDAILTSHHLLFNKATNAMQVDIRFSKVYTPLSRCFLHPVQLNWFFEKSFQEEKKR